MKFKASGFREEKKHKQRACASLLLPGAVLRQVVQGSEVVAEVSVQIPGGMKSSAPHWRQRRQRRKQKGYKGCKLGQYRGYSTQFTVDLRDAYF